MKIKLNATRVDDNSRTIELNSGIMDKYVSNDKIEIELSENKKIIFEKKDFPRKLRYIELVAEKNEPTGYLFHIEKIEFDGKKIDFDKDGFKEILELLNKN